MARSHIAAVVFAGSLGMLASCGVSEPVGGDLVGITVHGRVATEADVPVAGVKIMLGWRPMTACTTAFAPSDSAPSTDVAGVYGVLLIDTVTSQGVCVKVVATPPAALPLAAESIVLPNVALTTNGTYTVVVHDNDYANTGPYGVSLACAGTGISLSR